MRVHYTPQVQRAGSRLGARHLLVDIGRRPSEQREPSQLCAYMHGERAAAKGVAGASNLANFARATELHHGPNATHRRPKPHSSAGAGAGADAGGRWYTVPYASMYHGPAASAPVAARVASTSDSYLFTFIPERHRRETDYHRALHDQCAASSSCFDMAE